MSTTGTNSATVAEEQDERAERGEQGAQGDGDFLPAVQHALLHRILRLLDGCTATLNALGTLLIVGIMLAINADIFSRSAFNKPIAGVPEMVSLSIVAIVFLQVAHALRLGGLTRAEVLMERLPVRARAALEALYCLVGCGVCGVLFSGLLPLFERAWGRNLYVGVIGDFTAPLWPVRTVMLVGTVALGLQFLARALRAIACTREKFPNPPSCIRRPASAALNTPPQTHPARGQGTNPGHEARA